MNIFIFTPEPVGTFEVVKPVLQKAKQLKAAVVAYRDVEGESYTVIFAMRFKGKFEVV